MSRMLTRITMVPLLGFLASACAEQSTSTEPARAVQAGTLRLVDGMDVTPLSLAWQEQGRTLVAANNLSPLAAARVYAALSVAQYRAVMAIGDPDVDGELSGSGVGAGGRQALEARRGAVAGASAAVLSFFFSAAATNLEARVAQQGASTPGNKTHPWFAQGLAIGRGEGAAVVERARNDHFTSPWTGTVPTGPGKWIANGPPAGAALSGMTPYFLASASQFRPAEPPEFNSAAFLADLAEVKSLATNRTAAQQAIALFWNFTTGTMTPPGYWNTVAADYVRAYNLNERAATHTFALMHAAVMDAIIGCWDAKYYYWMIRPSQADAAIPLSFALPNHPSYPSGHSCASAAAGTVLGYLFPDRTADLDAQVAEAGFSRMLAGIHYRFDVTAGQGLGREVGRLAIGIDQTDLLGALRR